MRTRETVIKYGKRQMPATLTFPDHGAEQWVIFCHGFKGFKDWGFFAHMAPWFVREGMGILRFNFSGAGISSKQTDVFDQLDKFANNTISQELEDLKQVIEWVSGEGIQEFTDTPSTLHLLGHSLGGAVALQVASAEKRIKKLATWSTPHSFEHIFKNIDKENWRENQQITIENSRTKQQMPLHYSWWEDILEHRESQDLIKSAMALEIPYLIVHGTEDETVPLDSANQLYDSCLHAIKVEIQGGHTFGSAHPYGGQFQETGLRTLLENTIGFLVD